MRPTEKKEEEKVMRVETGRGKKPINTTKLKTRREKETGAQLLLLVVVEWGVYETCAMQSKGDVWKTRDEKRGKKVKNKLQPIQQLCHPTHQRAHTQREASL